MTREQRVTTNVMFRHGWYYVYPIYAPLLMIQQISGVPYRYLGFGRGAFASGRRSH